MNLLDIDKKKKKFIEDNKNNINFPNFIIMSLDEFNFRYLKDDKDFIPEYYYKNTNIIIDTNGHYDLHLDSLKVSLEKIIDYQLLENKYDMSNLISINDSIKNSIKVYFENNKECNINILNSSVKDKLTEFKIDIQQKIDNINKEIIDIIVKNIIDSSINIVSLINNNIKLFYERMYWITLFNLINPLNEIQSCELIEELSQYININHSDKNEYINNFEILIINLLETTN